MPPDMVTFGAVFLISSPIHPVAESIRERPQPRISCIVETTSRNEACKGTTPVTQQFQQYMITSFPARIRPMEPTHAQ